jgi:methanethiol S-methyltransferase
MLISVLTILLSFFLYGGLHSLLASRTAKDLARRWLGAPFVRRYYRFAFNLIGFVTFLPVMALVGLLPDRRIYAISMPWALLSGLVQLMAVLGLGVGVMQTGALNFLGLAQIIAPEEAERPHAMITNGLYARVRHPLYTCALIFLWLTPVMSWNVLAFNLGASAYLIVGAYFFEEPRLLDEFGAAYALYQKRVPMLAPRLFRRR